MAGTPFSLFAQFHYLLPDSMVDLAVKEIRHQEEKLVNWENNWLNV